ncbi:hypothetical protein M422DRAFT_65495 [Sphaerobolus stellatus SS14]|nr:hypothetical protein M422DRAFT_65495 [Sphaerobolus stellatus SS14]
MSNKPRASILDLFDPLLSKAVRVPIPDSPPSTPKKSHLQVWQDGLPESPGSNESTMSAFFSRILNPNLQSYSFDECSSNGSLIDFAGASDEELEQSEWTRSERVQDLTESDLTTSIHKTPRPKPSLHIVPSTPTAFPSSPSEFKNDISLCSSLTLSTAMKHISISSEDNLMATPNPIHAQAGKQDTKSPQPSPPTQTMSHSRRKSSLDISMAISASTSLDLATNDVSFDLLHGEMSFLSKLSEDDSGNLSDDYMQEVASTQKPVAVSDHNSFKAEEEIPSMELKNEEQEEHSLSPFTPISSRQNSPKTPVFGPSYTPTLPEQVSIASTSVPSSVKGTPGPRVTSGAPVLPLLVKKPKVFTSGHQRAVSIETVKSLGSKPRVPFTAIHQPRPGLSVSSSSSLPLKGGAKRVLVTREQDSSSSKAIPAPKRPVFTATNVKFPGPNPSINASKPKPVVTSRLASAGSSLRGPSQTIPSVPPKQAPSRLPAPVQGKGIGRGIPVRAASRLATRAATAKPGGSS